MKTALITGGSSGIGFAIARRFTMENYRTIITGRNESKLNKAAKDLGIACIPIPLDLEFRDRIPEFVRSIKVKYASIDVLINNAGINQKKPLVDVTDQEYDKVLSVNQNALFSLSREIAKLMLEQEAKGVIVNISSMAAHYGIPQVISYTASKSALEGMTKAMAVELSPHGIRVNTVAPGFIKTSMSYKALNDDPDRKKRVMLRTPMGKMGEPEDIANAVFFLASEQASFITGETLKVDGGNCIGF